MPNGGSIARYHVCDRECHHDPMLVALYQDWFGVSETNQGLRDVLLKTRDRVVLHELILRAIVVLGVSGGGAVAGWQIIAKMLT